MNYSIRRSGLAVPANRVYKSDGWGQIVNNDIDAAAAIAYTKLNLALGIVNGDISPSAAIAYSKLNLASSIVNADVSNSAAIAYSKLNLALSILNADISASAAIAYSKLSLGNSIVNSDINSAAAIAYSKLNLVGGIVNADISASAAITYSKLSLSGSIVNADVSASAGISVSKLETSATKGHGLFGTTTGAIYDPHARKNYLINGSMRVFQRGTVDNNYTGTDNAYVGPDRWRTLTSGATPSVRQSSVWIPSSGASNRSWLALSGGNHRFGLFQVIESADCWDLRGSSVSLQFQMTTPVGANISDVRAGILYWIGAADDTTAVTGLSADPVTTWTSLASGTPGNASGLANSWRFANTPANLNPTTSWAKYKIENVSIPSSATNVAVLIWAEDDTHTLNSDHLDVTDVQLEKGAVCTDFERIPYAQELLLCQRYFYRYASEPIGIAYSNTILATDNTQLLPVPMRVVPSISGATFSVNAGSAGTVAASAITTRSLRFYNSDSNWTITALVSLTATISAEL